jgi:Ceramidase
MQYLQKLSSRTKFFIIVFITLITAILVAQLPIIPQALYYHDFADHRIFVGIPNFLDVVSNLAFTLAGLSGLFLLYSREAQLQWKDKILYLIYFLGVILTSVGSAYYHLAPDNERLVWDRLPMTIVAMSLLAAILAERISSKAGITILLPLLALGLSSVIYWQKFDDLRPYGFVIFFPMILVPILLALFPVKNGSGEYFAYLIGFYLLAKLCEHFDTQIFAVGNVVSGHTLKHIIAALGLFQVVLMIKEKRRA